MYKITARCSDGATRVFTGLNFDIPDHYALWEHLRNYAYANDCALVPGFVTWRGKQIGGFWDGIEHTFATY